MTQCVVVASLAMVAACGQAKVEIKKVETIVVVPTPEPLVAPTLEALVEEAPIATPLVVGEVYTRTFLPISNATQLMDWQTWKPARKRGTYGLSEAERAGLGDSVEDAVLQNGESAVNLIARGSSQRCVFRNRLIDRGNSGIQLVRLPAPMGQQDLMCVSREVADRQEATVQLSIDDDRLHGGLRWVGTTARRELPTLKETRTVEMKVTQLVGFQQGFSTAIRKALPDQWDTLFNAASSSDGVGRDCGVTRSALLQVTVDHGTVTGGTLTVHTRMMSNQEQAATRRIFTQDDAATPVLDLQAASACAPQRAAWVACLTGQAQCSDSLNQALKRNFSDLLNARASGYISDRVMTVTRAEANGLGERGARDLVMWKSDPAAAAADRNEGGANPLSVEDFQEMIEIVPLVPARRK